MKVPKEKREAIRLLLPETVRGYPFVSVFIDKGDLAVLENDFSGFAQQIGVDKAESERIFGEAKHLAKSKDFRAYIMPVVSGLVKKHGLDSLEKKQLITEAEITRLKVQLSAAASEAKVMSFYESLVLHARLEKLIKNIFRNPSEKAEHQNKIDSLNLWLKSIGPVRYDKGIIDLVTGKIFPFSKHGIRTARRWKGKTCLHHTFEKHWETGEDCVHVHFSSISVPKSPFSKKEGEYQKRVDELKAIAKDVHDNHPEVQFLLGSSWLYNLPVYRELLFVDRLPDEKNPEIVLSPEPELDVIYMLTERKRFGMSIWGQFYGSNGEIKKDLAKGFSRQIDDFVAGIRKSGKKFSEKDYLPIRFPYWSYQRKCRVSKFFKRYLE